MTATKTPYSLTELVEAAPAERRGRVSLRRDLGITSFGVNAYHQAESGADVIREHDELGPGAGRHEELYLVVQGSCTFTVDGETVEAPRGTALFVPDPASTRRAVATEDGTTVVVVGGRPGEAFTISPAEAMGDFYRRYRDKDYAGALAECRTGLEVHPGNPLILYNVACMESLLGHSQEALAALAESLPVWPRAKELAADDEDLNALRGDPRFEALLAQGA
jgi:AraC-like ligand binding domain